MSTESTASRKKSIESSFSYAWLWKLLFVLLLGPILLFPSHFPQWVVFGALGLLLLSWIVYIAQNRRLFPRSPINFLLILLLLIFLPLSLWVSPLFWEVSWLKMTSLVWSAAIFFVVVDSVPAKMSRRKRQKRLEILTLIYIAIGLMMMGAGLLGMPRFAGLLPAAVQDSFFFFVPGTSINANEVGGVITLYLPLLVALWVGAWADPERRSWWRLGLWGLLILIAGAVLLLTASFGALAGALAGSALVVLIIDGRVRWLPLGGLLAVLGLLILRLSPYYDRLALAVNVRWTDSMFTRLAIWEQAGHVVQDFPLLGTGLGTFRYVAPALYPVGQSATDISHAHNLFLQAVLDFGWLGGLVFALIWLVVLFRLARSLYQTPGNRDPASLCILRAGFLGALVAHALYGMFDALAPGARPGFALWYLFGLSVASTVTAVPKTQQVRYWRAAVAAAVLLWFGVLLSLYWPLQQASSAAVRTLLAKQELNENAAALATGAVAENCRLNWHIGRLAHERGEIERRDAAWEQLLDCSAQHTSMMQVAAPKAQALADAAVAQQPQDAAGFFWRAAQEAEVDSAAAITYYEQGLLLSPTDGLKWVELGRLRESAGDVSGALKAYDEACFYVDHGKNGCPRAAHLYMAAGDYDQAADRYRTSLKQLPGWQPARRGLADALLAMGQTEEALPYLTRLAEEGDVAAQEQLYELKEGEP